MDFSFKKEVFEGSIFDGEIIQTKGPEFTWNYLIHDCMAYNGTSFLETNHRLRYYCGIDFITKRYNPKETDCFNIKTKLFYKYGPEITKTWELIQKTTENKIDGFRTWALNTQKPCSSIVGFIKNPKSTVLQIIINVVLNTKTIWCRLIQICYRILCGYNLHIGGWRFNKRNKRRHKLYLPSLGLTSKGYLSSGRIPTHHTGNHH